MANALYVPYKVALLGSGAHGAVDLDADDIKCVGTDHTDDTPNTTTDVDLADISAGTVATSGNLASKTTTGGVFDSADPTFTAATGDAFDSITLYKDSGSASTSPLIAYYDTATGLPFTPSGGDITITVHASGWFAL